MKKHAKLALCFIIIMSIMVPLPVYALEGNCGYEGGISSEQDTYGNGRKISLKYQEICFITGEPIIFSGTLTIDKSLKNDRATIKYEYDLENANRNASLRRSLELVTEITRKDNGQVIEKTAFLKRPTETVRIGNTVYTLTDYDFTRSNIIDSKPAINYYAGNTRGRKIYQIDAENDNNTVTVEITGDFYGYNQYWGTSDVQIFNYVIESQRRIGGEMDKWGGTARVSISSSLTKQLKYVRNEPDVMSFDGGYLESQYSSSVMEYSCKLPEFDSRGISTDRMIDKRGSLKTESFPEQSRLSVPDTRHIRGHWAEEDIRELYSLEIFDGDAQLFDPDKYITRAEFIEAFIKAAKEVPDDPLLRTRTSTRTGSTRRAGREEIVSPFNDVSVDSIYFNSIDNAYKRGLITGKNGNNFVPNGTITLADSIAIFIRALGLESMAPAPRAVTTFRDNDLIPDHARDAVYVAEKIGLIKGDNRGYLRPNESLTKARAAVLINRFIKYMRSGIRKSYREGIINFN